MIHFDNACFFAGLFGTRQHIPVPLQQMLAHAVSIRIFYIISYATLIYTVKAKPVAVSLSSIDPALASRDYDGA